MPKETTRLYKFGRFELDPAQRLLLRQGRIVQLTPKAVDLLLALVVSGGRVVSKEDLLQRLWPDSFVEEANLSHHIYKLREALGDGGSGELYIETLPRRGYRFVAAVAEIGALGDDVIIEEHSHSQIVVQESEVPDATEDVAYAPATKPKTVRRKLWMVATVLIVAAAALSWWLLARPGPTTVAAASIRSLAVLPFKPLAVEGRDEILELGMADTLITRLSSLQQVTVRPLSAVRKYMSLDQDALEAGRQLQVEAVLEGTLQKSGDHVRVTARLLRLSDGAQLWADKFDQKFTDIFALQDSIAESVVGKISQKLPAGFVSSKKGTQSTEAYLLYTRGRYYWSTFRREQLGDSISYFKAAIEKDPNYALAYAGLANAYSVAGIYGPLTPQEAYPLAKEAAIQALRLDDNLSEAHQSLGGNRLFSDWDWQGADAELRRAIELDPNNLAAHELHGYYWEAMGRANDAVREIQRAVEIDPGWLITNNDLTQAFISAGRDDEAIQQGEHTRSLIPDQPSGEVYLGYAYLHAHRFDEAIAAFRRAVVKINSVSTTRVFSAGLAYAYALSGHRTEALKELAGLEKQVDKNVNMSMNIAGVYAGLGDKDRALAMLERAYQHHYPLIWLLKLDQRFESLHSDPRFKDLLRRIGLPE